LSRKEKQDVFNAQNALKYVQEVYILSLLSARAMFEMPLTRPSNKLALKPLIKPKISMLAPEGSVIALVSPPASNSSKTLTKLVPTGYRRL